MNLVTLFFEPFYKQKKRLKLQNKHFIAFSSDIILIFVPI